MRLLRTAPSSESIFMSRRLGACKNIFEYEWDRHMIKQKTCSTHEDLVPRREVEGLAIKECLARAHALGCGNGVLRRKNE